MEVNKKMWLTAGLIIVFGVVISMILSNQKEPMRKRPTLSRQKHIKTVIVQNKDIQAAIQMTGHLYAYDKVDLFAEVSGVLQETKKRFKEGYQYKKGEILIQIDDSVFKNNLLAQKGNLLNQLTTTQFREAQLNLVRARSNHSAAKYSAKIKEIELLRLTGQLIKS